MKHSKTLICSLAVLLIATMQSHRAIAFDARAEPEAATHNRLKPAEHKKSFRARHHLVVTANPHASKAGRDILRLGGSAIDAAIAVQLVLNLVEPQSSGIGGGGFLLHWNSHNRRLTSFDGRETAPRSARAERFMNNDTPMKFRDAVLSGLSVGTPGLLKMLEKVHRRHGRLPWHQLFAPAIQLATNGFKVSPRLHALLKNAKPASFSPAARAYFFDQKGAPRPTGHRLKNPPFAQALTSIARFGSDYFYYGELSTEIARTVQSSHKNKGDMTTQDLAGYKAYERPPICISYRSYHICGMGPPSSGMLTIGQILSLIEPFNLGKTPLNTNALHIISEASKLAYADRNRYMADNDFVEMPQGLLDLRYLTKRSKLIKPDHSMGKAKPGHPPTSKRPFGRDATIENKGTSHISIIDHWGNAISLTSSIEGAFGAHIMVSGFLLNNELTDFSFRPNDKQGKLIANRVEPLKRPRSSMSPTMIFDKHGRLHMVTGSPGGSRIILYVLKTIIGHIDWGLDADAIAQLPNFGSRNGPLELEKGPGAENRAAQLRAKGHKIHISPMTSGVHLILRDGNTYVGAADPRREGIALGD